MSHAKLGKQFTVTLNGQTLTFAITFDRMLNRSVVNGPQERLDKAEAFAARKAAVEVARSLGLMEQTA